MKKVLSFFNTDGLPTWFIIVNILNLALILAWPIVAFMSVFMLDKPNPSIWIILSYILINVYPLFLILNLILTFKLYKRNKTIAIILTVLPLLFATIVFLLIMNLMLTE